MTPRDNTQRLAVSPMADKLREYISGHGFDAFINPLAQSVSFWLPASDGSNVLITVDSLGSAREALGY